MTTYAKATNVRVPYLTEGREYEVVREDYDDWFCIIDEQGHELSFRWGQGGFATLQRIEKEEA